MQIQLDRRPFIQRAALTVVGLRLAQGAALLGVAEMEAGCGSVFNDILNWIPVGEAAVNSILAVLAANGVILIPGLQVYVSLIEAGLTALTGAIKEYQSTVPAPVGALAKIETAFKDVVDNFKNFLASLNVSGGLLAIIVGIAQVVLSTIAAFMNQLPAASSLKRTVVLGHTFLVGSTTAVVIPKDRTRRAFKRDFNSVLDGGPSAGVVIPPSARLKLSFWEKL
jgi:hypothetical protein